MPELGALVATFIAGLLSFLSPCTAPLLPAYLTVVSGVGAAELSAADGRRRFRGRLVLGSMLYVAGFTVVFVGIGLGAGSLGPSLLRARRPVEVVGGLLVVLLGLVILGVVRVPTLMRERRLELPESWRRLGVGVAFPIGIVFGIGWTPCIGPFLGAAYTLAGASGTAIKGGILLLVYSLGLGLPFIGVALAWASLPSLPARLSRLSGPAAKLGGVLTVGMGLAVATGAYSHVTSFFASISTPS